MLLLAVRCTIAVEVVVGCAAWDRLEIAHGLGPGVPIWCHCGYSVCLSLSCCQSMPQGREDCLHAVPAIGHCDAATRLQDLVASDKSYREAPTHHPEMANALSRKLRL